MREYGSSRTFCLLKDKGWDQWFVEEQNLSNNTRQFEVSLEMRSVVG